MKELAPGSIIDRKYALEKPLGEGGMGVVWLARDVHTEVPVVVKAIRAEYAHRKDFRDRILAEGRALARIDHPNVVRLNAVVSDEDGLCLVMQFIEGETLEDRIARHAKPAAPLSVAQALALFRPIVQGVAAAHAEGIIHRDLKPANVLIRGKDGIVKVTDFGIAKEESDAQKGKGNTEGVIGSVLYMSPEQCTGKKDLDKRVDVYSLGIVLYELLVGQVPFDGESHYMIMTSHVREPLPKIRARRPDVPAWLEAVAERCAEKRREDRFGSCEEILAALDTQGQGLSGRTAPAAPLHLTAPAAPLYANVTAPPGVPQTAEASVVTAPGNEPTSKRGLAVALTVGIAALAGLGISYSLGLFGAPKDERHADAKGPPAVEHSASASAHASAAPSVEAKNPLLALAGRWRSESGREYDAVLVGDRLEMRIRDAKPFALQGYEEGEARFVLRALPGKTDVFGVEDRLRPNPPAGNEYDVALARSTCIVPYTEIGGKPLEARLDGGKLRVSMVQTQPPAASYTLAGKRVTGCKNLATAPLTPIESVLGRP
ncbi:serine/threonine-protein kinase [Polyangium sp. 15x6]|uniref:serine/threonine-protein kinase n=1 Tax=Polyangium sp. 15x6 TaxID=3042687 RepID=UPI002499E999|nr:serine/threonine-protein kinase [Polyangium sp. 15x6]MDI3283138.1 serine/threonine-protein kinase [Polyangium sp. 15x6]